MTIYPAIDIIDGACVRLVRGDYSQKTKYADNPLEVALKWQEQGGKFLHIVDLDGAKSGNTPNFEIIKSIAKNLCIPIEIGGGVRDEGTVKKYLDCGVRRVILGTSAVKDTELLKELADTYGDRIVVGIDAKDGMVAVNGWEEVSSVSAVDFGIKVSQMGVKTIIYTDIATDGMLKGPNLKAMEEMAKAVNADVVASGGVSSVEDVKNLKKTGVEGVIIGKALYTGKISIKDAISAAE